VKLEKITTTHTLSTMLSRYSEFQPQNLRIGPKGLAPTTTHGVVECLTKVNCRYTPLALQRSSSMYAPTACVVMWKDSHLEGSSPGFAGGRPYSMCGTFSLIRCGETEV
jgi:hypothetical protein